MINPLWLECTLAKFFDGRQTTLAKFFAILRNMNQDLSSKELSRAESLSVSCGVTALFSAGLCQ